MKCPICLIEMTGMPMPCGIGPRVYVGSSGVIEAMIPGCPSEINSPNYLPSAIVYKSGPDEEKLSRRAMKRFVEIAQSFNHGHYQDLWSARDGENYHLDFDARDRVLQWLRAVTGGVSNIQSLSYKGSKGSYLRAFLRKDTVERSYLVSDDTLRVLQTAKTRKARIVFSASSEGFQ